ncbi:MAG: M3 family metallopeptidase, partial [Synergistaceae bacterium]|nr:M3 family metallopeptidase [Synergistaceae bacterium]
ERIPHFSSAFYVYKYVTGFTAAGAFAGTVLDEERRGKTSARERYIDFLKSGSSAFSLDILKKAGIDLESPEPFDLAMAAFRDKLEEAEKLF